MLAVKIKELRERNGLKQSNLAKILNVTRSSVNAWEMGISVPSAQFIVRLAQIFTVSADYLLGVDDTATISVKDLDVTEVGILVETANKFRENKK